MKTIAGVLMLAVLICDSGCARTDWIERTLVTVDVTGTWNGSVGGQAGSKRGWHSLIELEQQASTVKGSIRLNLQGSASRGYGTMPRLIDGTVAGVIPLQR